MFKKKRLKYYCTAEIQANIFKMFFIERIKSQAPTFTFALCSSLQVMTEKIQGDQKVSMHLMITIQKVTSNVQSVPRQSPDIYWHSH
jgi:preprotein translocase subunit Sec63